MRTTSLASLANVRGPSPTALPGEAEVLARATSENFPVALRVLPRSVRADLLAIYGYARLVDQIGDSYTGDRLAALDRLATDLEIALSVCPARADPPRARSTPDGAVHPVVTQVVATLATHSVDPQPLRDLLEANRQDQLTSSYATFDDLLGYCQLSANPVGRLVLGVFDAVTPEHVAWSDAVCSGLQLAEHCQDVVEDARAGRVYLPVEDLERFAVDPAALRATGTAGPALRALMAFEVSRARRLLEEGTPLIRSLRGWARVAVTGFVAGGRGALDAIADAGFDPLGGAPAPSSLRVARHAIATLSARAGRAK